MADLQTNSIADTAASPAREARQTANRQADGAARQAETQIEGERRSFEQQAENVRHVGAVGAAATGDIARTAAAASRQLGETGRRTGREVAEAWRSALDPFSAMRMDMSRSFDELWRQMAGFNPLSSLHVAKPFSGLGAASLFGLPPADLRETDQAYVLAVELPGLSRDQVDLAAQGEVLTIRGHKADDRAQAGAAYRISERRFGQFERSFPIPPDVDRGRIDATFHDGLLTITLAKTAQAEGREARIEIKG